MRPYRPAMRTKPPDLHATEASDTRTARLRALWEVSPVEVRVLSGALGKTPQIARFSFCPRGSSDALRPRPKQVRRALPRGRPEAHRPLRDARGGRGRVARISRRHLGRPRGTHDPARGVRAANRSPNR